MKLTLVVIVFALALWLFTMLSVTHDAIPEPVETVATSSTTTTTAPPPTTTTSTVPPTTAPRVVARSAPTAPSKRDGSVWDRLAACESGGHWDDTRGGYFGGVHFMRQTWIAAGGQRYAPTANLATREQQIAIAKSWLGRTSVRQWPVCGPRVGLTMADAA